MTHPIPPRRSARTLAMAALAAAAPMVLAASLAHAQLPNPFENAVFRKFFNPVVGRGEIYETTRSGGERDKERHQFQIVGKEMVDGQTAYWFEMVMDAPELGGRAVGKSLFVPGGFKLTRSIIQYPGMEPMELTIRPGARKYHEESHNEHQVGTETITVPAGTFACEHWKDDRGSEAWISSRVSPITVVKSVEKGETMVLVRQLTDVHDAITGRVVPFDGKRVAQHMREAMSQR